MHAVVVGGGQRKESYSIHYTYDMHTGYAQRYRIRVASCSIHVACIGNNKTTQLQTLFASASRVTVPTHYKTKVYSNKCGPNNKQRKAIMSSSCRRHQQAQHSNTAIRREKFTLPKHTPPCHTKKNKKKSKKMLFPL
jgi:hypothetical protein